jgi:hypothetical protein
MDRTRQSLLLRAQSGDEDAWKDLCALYRPLILVEAELAARVQHPNIVQIYEIGTHDGRPFLALEWVEAAAWRTGWTARPGRRARPPT